MVYTTTAFTTVIVTAFVCALASQQPRLPDIDKRSIFILLCPPSAMARPRSPSPPRGLVAEHLAWICFVFGVVAMHSVWVCFLLGLAAVHLAWVCFIFGLVAVHLAWIFFTFGLVAVHLA